MYLRTNLNYLLKKNRISLRKMAADINMSHATFSRMLNGFIPEDGLSLRTVIKLTEYFELSLDEIVYCDLSHEEMSTVDILGGNDGNKTIVR